MPYRRRFGFEEEYVQPGLPKWLGSWVAVGSRRFFMVRRSPRPRFRVTRFPWRNTPEAATLPPYQTVRQSATAALQATGLPCPRFEGLRFPAKLGRLSY